MHLEKSPEWCVGLWQLDVELESLFQSTVLPILFENEIP